MRIMSVSRRVWMPIALVLVAGGITGHVVRAQDEAPTPSEDAAPETPRASVGEVRRAAKGFTGVMVCKSCKGTGEVPKTTIKHKKAGTGKTFGSRVEETVMVPCTACDEHGYEDGDRFDAALTKFLNAMANINTADPKSDATIDAVMDQIVELREKRPAGFDSRINEWVREPLATTPDSVGSGVMVVGSLESDVIPKDGSTRVRVITVDGHWVVRLTEPLGGHATIGRRVIVTGVITGNAERDGLQRTMVPIERGVIVEVP